MENKHARIDKTIDESWLYSLIKAPPVGDLPDLFKKSSFKIVSLQSVTKDGRKLVELVYSNKHDLTAIPFDQIQGGTLFLDPSKYWCLIGGSTTVEYSNGWGTWKHETTLFNASFLGPQRLIVEDDGTIPDWKSKDEKKLMKLWRVARVVNRFPLIDPRVVRQERGRPKRVSGDRCL